MSTITRDPATVGPQGKPLLRLKPKAPPQPPEQPKVAPAPLVDIPTPSRKPTMDDIRAELANLKERWPMSIGACVPLAVGCGPTVVTTAMDEGRSGKLVRLALNHYAKDLAYLNAVAADGSRRLNLDGSDAGPVADEHRAYAVDEIRKIKTQILENRYRSKLKTKKAAS